ARHDFYNLEPVAGLQLAPRKFRRRHGLAVVFHHHAARQKFLPDEKLLDGAGKARFDGMAVGYNRRVHGGGKLFDTLSNTTSSVSPNVRFSPADVIVKLFVDLNTNLYGVPQTSTICPSLFVEDSDKVKRVNCWGLLPVKFFVSPALSFAGYL